METNRSLSHATTATSVWPPFWNSPSPSLCLNLQLFFFLSFFFIFFFIIFAGHLFRNMHRPITVYLSLSFTLLYIISVLQSVSCLTTEAERAPILDLKMIFIINCIINCNFDKKRRSQFKQVASISVQQGAGSVLLWRQVASQLWHKTSSQIT